MGDDRIPVFDDFGRLVGWFTPAGGGGLLGCLAALVMLIVLPLILLPLWLIAKGREKWKQGDEASAVLAWMAATAIILAPFAIYASHQHEQQVRREQRQAARVAREAEIQKDLANLEELIAVESVRHGIPDTSLGCTLYCGDEIYSLFTLANSSSLRVEIRSSVQDPNGFYEHCIPEGPDSWGWVIESVGPKETIKAYCLQSYKSQGEWITSPRKNCIWVEARMAMWGYHNQEAFICAK